MGKRLRGGLVLLIFGMASIIQAQTPAPRGEDAAGQASPTPPDHARAYYHFMMARRYKELAGVYNRRDYLDRAVGEYKQAIEADPASLFLRVDLAELYFRQTRMADAVREADAVLKLAPNFAAAHRLLARIYWNNLGDLQANQVAAKESLGKAIFHLETLTRLSPDDSEAALMLGRLYRANNEIAKAEEVFKKAWENNPSSRSALISLAQLYFDQGEYEQAAELLKGIPEPEMDPPLLAMLGYAYAQSRDFANARAAYEKALNLSPESREIRRAYAEMLMDSGDGAAARSELEKVLEAGPDDLATYLRLAQLNRQDGKYEEARAALEKAQTLAPNNQEVLYQQAILEDVLGNEDKAIQLLRQLVKKSEKAGGNYSPGEAGNRAIFLERLGMIYRSREKYDEALAAFREVAALGGSQAVRGTSLVIDTLRVRRQLAKALQEAEAAVQKFPDHRPLQLQQAGLLGEMGRVDEAVQKLQALIKGTPGDREIYLSMAQVYSQARQFAEAETAVRQGLELSSKMHEQEYAWFLLGSVLERQKKYAEAEEQFKKVLATNPLNAPAANYLGYMLADLGVRLDESLEYIKKAVQLEPNNGAYLDSLGWAYYKMGKLDLALDYLQKAAQLISNDPTIHEHLGYVYLRLGKMQQAREAWEHALKVWPQAVGGDFDAAQAAKLQKELEALKLPPAKGKTKK